MIIIPAIDIIDGKAVRLSEGNYDQKTIYADDPLDVAKAFEQAGFARLHLVDLDGAKKRKITNLAVLERIAKNTILQIDYGGGVVTSADVTSVFNAGGTLCTIGSIAVKKPELLSDWINEFGAGKFFIGADVLNRSIRVSGWMEDAEISIFEFLKKMIALGAINFFCTDISKDGMLQGPAISLYKEIIAGFPGIQLTASGGVSTVDDIAALQVAGCAGVIVGKAIYENRISLKELIKYNSSC